MSVFIDKRIRHVGTSHLRHFNADTLRELDDTVFVIQDGDEPVSVLLSYKLFLHIQDTLERLTREVELEREAGAGEST